ncbi:hypothetical protein EV193_10374 [Herbihabitans rhizosphaerae]|uniref:Uncharacterized protein n=1 Tax=Herbihabitans rhizosphaerae TaxID=1872711 RepID=A0A4Q7KXN0_9PSEU|nr:hypothetical protein [Herbihabitans rhizosphaerae]RZS40761.1 hypothetical protein EV193_10374 [Herbihabitans rhizosphaerae]
MPIFTQVWLWSLTSFVVGALLTWVLIARPARKRVAELERDRAAARRRAREQREQAELARAEEYPIESASREDEDFDPARLGGYGSEPERAGDAGTQFLPYAGAGAAGLAGGAIAGSVLGDADQHDPAAARTEYTEYPIQEHDDQAAQRGQLSLSTSSGPSGEAGGGALSGSLDTSYAPPEPPEVGPDTELADGPATQIAGRPFVTGGMPQSSSRFQESDLLAPAEVEEPAGGRDWFAEVGEPGTSEPADEPVAAEVRDENLVEDVDESEEVDEGGTVFTQRTTPVSAELIREIDEAPAPGEQASEEAAEPGAISAALSPGGVPPESATDYLDTSAESTQFVAAQGESPSGELTETVDPERTTTVDPAALEQERQAAEQTVEAEPVEQTQAVPQTVSEAAEPTRSIFEPNRTVEENTQAVDHATVMPAPDQQPIEHLNRPLDEPERTQAAPLPVRRPGASALAQRIKQSASPSRPQPAAPPRQRDVSGEASASEPTRSLFEPMIPAKDLEPHPPRESREVHRSPAAGRAGGQTTTFVPPGPFGPGSAMPLAGGASPSSEFTIKASVTALRYCTPESPDFGRTVAEVWFRSVDDAEKVGFRPLS